MFDQLILYGIWLIEKMKNLLSINKKVRRKSMIPKYNAPSFMGMIKIIHEQSIDKKHSNLVRNWEEKLNNL